MDEIKLAERGRRALHLVDIENLAGGAHSSPEEMRSAITKYIRVAGFGAGDQMVVASSHHAAGAAWFAAPRRARRLVRSGPDGADLALLDELTDERLVGRYERVVIGSGDGVFAESTARLHHLVEAVTVVAPCPESLSKRLRMACLDVRFAADARAAAAPAFGSAF